MIGGKRVEGVAYESRNPARLEDLVAVVDLVDANAVLDACRAAKAAQREWGAVPAPVRGLAIQELGRLVEAHAHLPSDELRERILREARPLVLVESHMPDEDRAISNVLTRHRYDGYRLNTKSWIVKPEAVHPEPDGVWGTVLLVPKERRAALAAVVGG